MNGRAIVGAGALALVVACRPFDTALPALAGDGGHEAGPSSDGGPSTEGGPVDADTPRDAHPPPESGIEGGLPVSCDPFERAAVFPDPTALWNAFLDGKAAAPIVSGALVFNLPAGGTRYVLQSTRRTRGDLVQMRLGVSVTSAFSTGAAELVRVLNIDASPGEDGAEFAALGFNTSWIVEYRTFPEGRISRNDSHTTLATGFHEIIFTTRFHPTNGLVRVVIDGGLAYELLGIPTSRMPTPTMWQASIGLDPQEPSPPAGASFELVCLSN